MNKVTLVFDGGKVEVEHTIGGPVVTVYRQGEDEPVAVVCVEPDDGEEDDADA